jgi:molybdenum cofactor cytidylyltransferase
MRITAIVLAAGESRRMGALKPLLPFGNSTVIETVASSLLRCPIDTVLVVVGHRSEEIARQLAPYPVETVLNDDYAAGMLTSVQRGVAAAPADTEWFVIALADQPALDVAVTTSLIQQAREGTPGILVPTFDGRRGHPLLIHRRYREEIAALSPEIGLRELMRRHPDDVRHIAVAQDAILRDMDTPEEYQAEVARARRPEPADE